jgi:hypothetical protein
VGRRSGDHPQEGLTKFWLRVREESGKKNRIPPILWHLSGLGTSYIILRKAGIFNQKNKFLEENIFVKKNEEYSGIFKNYLIFENESSKLNNYSTDMCRNCPLCIIDFWRHAGTYCLNMAI